MRVWDINPEFLCDKHLLAQHFEIHCIYNIVKKIERDSNVKVGYKNHPEVKRWIGKRHSLVTKHNRTLAVMVLRRFNHKSPLLDFSGSRIQDKFLISKEKQIELLKSKDCDCFKE